MTTREQPLPSLQVEAGRCLLFVDGLVPVILQVSPATLAARHWPQGRPGPLALERAIDDVENAIEQAGLRHADRGRLQAGDSLRQLLPPRWGAAGEFSRDDVEAEFSRLVAASEAAGVGATPALVGEVAAALLLLRELMHHLGFKALSAAD